MDATAIQVVNDDILRNEYHIKARGDLYALRAFCEEREDKKKKWNNDNKKKELIDMLLKGRKEKKTSGKEKSQNKVKGPTCTSDTDITKKTRKISLGWLNYDEKIKKYKHVREIQGGGTRPISVPSTFTKEDVLQEAINVYLSKDDERNMEVELGNFKAEAIKEDDLGVPFTVENYYKSYKLSRARFYLMTRPKAVAVYDDDSSDEESLMKNPFDIIEGSPSGLLGTSGERVALRAEQQRAYEESLEADCQKEEQKRQKLEKEKQHPDLEYNQNIQRLKEVRKARTPSEPGKREAHFTIAVRHPSFGTLRRRFRVDAVMSSVYDWLGSLQTEPPYFMLKFVCMAHENWISPSSPVSIAANNVLLMDACEKPLPLSEDDPEVSFLGYGQEKDGLSANDDTLSHNVSELDYIPEDEELPLQIFDNEESAHEEV